MREKNDFDFALLILLCKALFQPAAKGLLLDLHEPFCCRGIMGFGGSDGWDLDEILAGK